MTAQQEETRAVMWLPIKAEWSAFFGQYCADPESLPADDVVRVTTHAEAMDRCVTLLEGSARLTVLKIHAPWLLLSSLYLARLAQPESDFAKESARKRLAQTLANLYKSVLGLAIHKVENTTYGAIGAMLVRPGELHGKWTHKILERRGGVEIILVE